jgi:hypothetical protein
VQVRQADLFAHAGRVEAISAHVTTAGQAAAATRAGAAAYGSLCVMVPVALSALEDILVGGISAMAESLQDTGSRLRTTAREYEAADRRRGAVFQAIKGAR